METAVERNADQLLSSLSILHIDDQERMLVPSEGHRVGCGSHSEVCSICLDKIVLQETALVKGCEHAYCVSCILQWASYKEGKPTCPQCKHPFESLNIHRSLDGSIHDYMFEESVCLLLRASWFQLVTREYNENNQAIRDELEEYYRYYQYEEDVEDDGLDEAYFGSSSSLRVCNQRWGDNEYVTASHQEARPNVQGLGAGSSSREPKKKEPVKDTTGRRAKRALKREAADKADKAAAAKHEQLLARLGRRH